HRRRRPHGQCGGAGRAGNRRESLAVLLSAVLAARDEMAAASGRTIPVFLKIAPDLTEEGMDDIAAEVLSHALDGLIVSNTT
ncbi:hypothetical protein ACC771_22970, partial [Rhizobium ruizarguesonis]